MSCERIGDPAETIDLSYLQQVSAWDWLQRLLTHNGLRVQVRGDAVVFNESSHGWRTERGSVAICYFSIGRQIKRPGEVTGLSLSEHLHWHNGGFCMGLQTLNLQIQYEGPPYKRRRSLFQGCTLDKIPAHLTRDMLQLRVRKRWYTLVDEVYQELLSEVARSLDHHELHTDNSDYDL